MSALPIPCAFIDDHFVPLPGFAKIARRDYGQGEVVVLAPYEERSEASHRHEFAWLREAWQTLPDHLAEAYPSANILRKGALIATGWCTVKDYVCQSKAEANRTAATIRGELSDYAVVIVRDDVVRVCRAKSQSRGKMKAADFQASKTAIIEWVAALLGVEPSALSSASGSPAQVVGARSRDVIENPPPTRSKTPAKAGA